MAKDRKYELFMTKDDLKELITCEIPMTLADLLDEYETTSDQQLIGVILEYLLLWKKYQKAADSEFFQQPK